LKPNEHSSPKRRSIVVMQKVGLQLNLVSLRRVMLRRVRKLLLKLINSGAQRLACLVVDVDVGDSLSIYFYLDVLVLV